MVGGVPEVGTIYFHFIGRDSYSNSFYFVSMLATAEGPTSTPTTVLGKLFALLIAFVSVGAVVFALVFLFGPFFAKMFRAEEKGIKKMGKIAKDIRKL